MKKRRKRKINTGAISTFYCVNCQADKSFSNLRNLQYTHVSDDRDQIRVLAMCGKCKGEVSRIVTPSQFEQLRKKKRIYEVLDDKHEFKAPPSLPKELYSKPSAPKNTNTVLPTENENDYSSSSASDDDNDVNDQADLINSLSDGFNMTANENCDDDKIGEEHDLKRMNMPPNLNDLGSSSYSFKPTKNV